MAICPKCGNQIQAWAHGVCHTCGRIERDHKRYGRRQPPKRRKKSKSIPSRTRMLRCNICGREVRSDRLGSHRWNAHGIRPYSSDKPVALGQPPAIPPEPEKELIACPFCNNRMPVEKLLKHLEHHIAARQQSQRRSSGRTEKPASPAKQRSPQSTSSRVKKPASPAKQRSPQSTSSRAKKPASPVRQHSPQSTSRRIRKTASLAEQRPPMDRVTKIRLKGTNLFLSDLYEQPTLISDILRANGLTDIEIRKLRQRHLKTFLSFVTGRWRTWWKSFLPLEGVKILAAYYGLGGQPPRSHVSIASSSKVFTHSVWQLQNNCLKELRNPGQKQTLERIVVEVAQKLVAGQ